MRTERLAEGLIALRAGLQRVRRPGIDVLGRWAMRADVTGLAARLLGAFLRRGLQVHRLHAGGRRGTDRRVLAFGLQSLPVCGFLSQLQDGGNGLLAWQRQKGQRLLAIHAVADAAVSARRQCRVKGYR